MSSTIYDFFYVLPEDCPISNLRKSIIGHILASKTKKINTGIPQWIGCFLYGDVSVPKGFQTEARV